MQERMILFPCFYCFRDMFQSRLSVITLAQLNVVLVFATQIISAASVNVTFVVVPFRTTILDAKRTTQLT